MNIVDLRKHNTSTENQEISGQPERENHLTEENIRQYINPQRRKLLKFLLVGGGAFVLGLLTRSLGFSGLFSKSKTKPETQKPETQTEKDFENWKVVENNNQAIFIDKKANEEVLILDWGNKDE